MAIFTRCNGSYRTINSSLVKVNGVFRESNNQYVKVNGIFREVSSSKPLTEEDIIGFKFIYRLNKNKIHPDFPNLKFNKKVPYNIYVTGENWKEMNDTDKSVLFEFNRNEYKEEGIVCYDGQLFAIDKNNKMYNVTSISHIPDYYEERNQYNLFKNITIKINAKYRWELFGYHLYGWNNFFTGNKFEFHNKLSDLPITPGGRFSKDMKDFVILQPEFRDKNYSNLATIGIARDSSTAKKNMVGSKGILDHTINDVIVNGIKKPFMIEIR